MSVSKLSWGTKIAALYIGFATLIVTLVAASMRQDFDLVTPDYYEQEINYQQVIDADKNLATLNEKVGIDIQSTSVNITFPSAFAGQKIDGTVHFYSPVNKKWDKTFLISTNGNQMTVDKTQLHKSAYTVKITWEADGKQYYQETNINLW